MCPPSEVPQEVDFSIGFKAPTNQHEGDEQQVSIPVMESNRDIARKVSELTMSDEVLNSGRARGVQPEVTAAVDNTWMQISLRRDQIITDSCDCPYWNWIIRTTSSHVGTKPLAMLQAKSCSMKMPLSNTADFEHC
jgi:hypothetical protein